MYRILLDTNVLVDYLLGREPGCSACKEIIALSGPGQHALLAASTSMKDAYYLTRSTLKRQERIESGSVSEGQAQAASEVAWACIRQLMHIVTVVPVGRGECLDAMALRVLHDDFEDNLVLAAVREVDADFLVTGDSQLVRHAPVACLAPEDMAAFLAREAEGCN